MVTNILNVRVELLSTRFSSPCVSELFILAAYVTTRGCTREYITLAQEILIVSSKCIYHPFNINFYQVLFMYQFIMHARAALLVVKQVLTFLRGICSWVVLTNHNYRFIDNVHRWATHSQTSSVTYLNHIHTYDSSACQITKDVGSRCSIIKPHLSKPHPFPEQDFYSRHYT